MATRRRHKKDTKTFGELSLIEQARSINAQIIILERAIRANLRKTQNQKHQQTKDARIKQLKRLLGRVAKI